MENCVFCKIISGEIPSNKIWEDENFLAFLDIDQNDKGHTLVIPKKHYRWVWDVEDYCGYFEKIREVKEILDKKYSPEFVEIKVWGVDVSHAHVHLIPHYRE